MAKQAAFTVEVEQDLREASDPTVTRISNEEFAAGWKSKRAALAWHAGGPQGLQG